MVAAKAAWTAFSTVEQKVVKTAVALAELKAVAKVESMAAMMGMRMVGWRVD